MTAPAPIERIEAALTWACDGGTPTGWVPVWWGGQTEATFEGPVAGERTRVRIPRLAHYAGQFVEGRILRAWGIDGTRREYRIQERRVSTLPEEPDALELVATSPVCDLAESTRTLFDRVAGVVRHAPGEVQDTPTNLLTTWVLGNLPSYWDLGTISPTASVAVDITAGMTPLQFAVAVAEAATAMDGVSYELWAAPSGSTALELHLGRFHDTVTGYAVGRRNLQQFVRTGRRQEQTTRVVPIGTDGFGIGDHRFNTSGVSTAGTYVEISHLRLMAANPIVADDAWNGYYLESQRGTRSEILATDRAQQRLTLAAVTDFVVDEWCSLRLNSSGDELAELDHPTAVLAPPTGYGPRLGVIRPARAGRTNLNANPVFADWPGTFPDGYGGNPAKITTPGLWRTGGQSARLSASGGAGSLNYFRLNVWLRAGTYTYSLWVLAVGSSNPWTVNWAGAGAVPISSLTFSGWQRLDHAVVYASDALRTISWALGTGVGGVGDFLYVDAAQFVRDEATDEPLVASPAAELLQAGVDHLLAAADPVESYTLRVADLRRISTALQPAAQFVHGGLIEIDDDDLGTVSSQRIVRAVWDDEDPAESELTLARRLPLLSRSV